MIWRKYKVHICWWAAIVLGELIYILHAILRGT